MSGPLEEQIIQEIVIRAFHGTNELYARSILLVGFKLSTGPQQRFGAGVYFWEEPEHAWNWAEYFCDPPPSVLSATISLGKCLDLTEHDTKKELFRAFRQMKSKIKKMDIHEDAIEPMVIQWLAVEQKADSVRGAFEPRHPVIPGGWIFMDRQVAICVRNTNRIFNVQLEAREVQ